MDKTSFTVKENTNPGEPLLDIYVPQGQQVTLGPSSTLFAFRIQGNQLFLNVTPDYEVWTADPGWLCPWGRQGPPMGPTWALTVLPREGLSGALWVSVCPGGLLGPQAWLRAWSRGWTSQGVKLPGPDACWMQGGDMDPEPAPAALRLLSWEMGTVGGASRSGESHAHPLTGEHNAAGSPGVQER